MKNIATHLHLVFGLMAITTHKETLKAGMWNVVWR